MFAKAVGVPRVPSVYFGLIMNFVLKNILRLSGQNV